MDAKTKDMEIFIRKLATLALVKDEGLEGLRRLIGHIHDHWADSKVGSAVLDCPCRIAAGLSKVSKREQVCGIDVRG